MYNNNNITSVLASFTTLKILNDSHKYRSSYQILGEFITYIVANKSLLSFSAVEMKNQLKEVFDFDLPEAVVISASKKLPYISRENNMFLVSQNESFNIADVSEAKASADNINNYVFDKLCEYVKSQNPDMELDISELSKAFISFVLDDQHQGSGKYTDLIGKFILKNENDNRMQEGLTKVREGSILYLGLNYNIVDTGSLNHKLVLFLDTEVLFSLIGYNGEICKKLAEDFYNQVKSANAKEKKIELYYFSDVKGEIDKFFDSAKYILAGKKLLIDRPAMKAIIKGCQTESDIDIKRSDFYVTLQCDFGIKEDDYQDYNLPENEKYNFNNPQNADTQVSESWKFIGYINTRRESKTSSNDLKSQYLLVTNTRNTLNASDEVLQLLKKNGDEAIDYAVSVNKITNILWYKLGNGFGAAKYPSNVNAIIKARIVLASIISNNIEEVFISAKDEYSNGTINEEKFLSRIATLHKKPILPEELEGDSIEDSMNFSSEYISRFEEEHESNKKELEKKDNEIQRMGELLSEKEKNISQKKQDLEKKEEIIVKQDNALREKDQAIEKKDRELEEYKEKERIRQEQKIRKKEILKFVGSVSWKLAIILAVIAVSIILNNYFDSKILDYISVAVNLLTIVGSVAAFIKKDMSKIGFKKKK